MGKQPSIRHKSLVLISDIIHVVYINLAFYNAFFNPMKRGNNYCILSFADVNLWFYLWKLSLPSDARKTDICDRKTNIESAKLKYNTHMSTPILYKQKKKLIELVFTLTIFLQNVFDIFTKETW